MAQLTQQQVVAYNKKVEAAKQKASQDKARKELAEQELERTCAELTELLGKEITPDNLEAEYTAFKNEALKTMESGTKILDGLEREAAESSDSDDEDEFAPAKSKDTEDDDIPTPKTTATKAAAADIDLDDLLGDV